MNKKIEWHKRECSNSKKKKKIKPTKNKATKKTKNGKYAKKTYL